MLYHLDDPGGAEQALGVGHGMQQHAASAGADQAALLRLIPKPIGALGGQDDRAAGVADALYQLDGGLPPSTDGTELVEDQGDVFAAAGLAEGGVVGEVLQQQPTRGVGVLPAGQVGRSNERRRRLGWWLSMRRIVER